MEHGILRENSKAPKGNVKFGPSDPRCRYKVKLDPRVHFALVCGSKGCPPVKIYSERNLDRGLDAATKFFLDDPQNCRISGNEVQVSQIFEWYAKDFDPSVVEFIGRYLEKDLKGYKVSYLKYDWDLNGSEK